MSFLKPHEHNIIMDIPDLGQNPVLQEYTNYALTADNLKAFRDAGAETTLEFLPWNMVEQERGVRDWSFTDEMVERCRAAGMKVLFMLPTTVPLCLPDEWYVWDEMGHVFKQYLYQGARQTWGCLSPWNDDARGYLLDFIREACDRYNAPDVLCINAQSQEGEALFPPSVLCAFDPAATRNFKAFAGSDAVPNEDNPTTMAWLYRTLRDLLIQEQEIFVRHPSRTVFTSMHPIYTDEMWKCSGNYDITYYTDAIRQFVRPATHHHILFAWFGRHGFERFWPWVKGEQAKGTQFICGGEWPEGLPITTPLAIAQGIRALLTAPIHPFLKRREVKPWMVDNVRDSARAFREAHAVAAMG